jgi:ArsR family transcriptional regulator, arsenate/arsenite/antimonite-responsive transcriptional repressor
LCEVKKEIIKNMPKVKFISTPGYIYDLIGVFTLHFNKNFYQSNFTNKNKTDSDIEFYDRIISEFGVISEDLLIFFYMKNADISFMTKYYFSPNIEKLIDSFNFDILLDDLSDYEKLTNNIFEYYFTEEEKISDIVNSVDKISDIIDSSNYSDIVKLRLLNYFIKPSKMIQKLINELKNKEVLLSKYYEKNYKITLQTQEQFDIDDFAPNLTNINESLYLTDNIETVYVAICLIVKNIICTIGLKTSSIILIGFDYKDCSEMLIKRKDEVKLDIFGKIISDKNRFEILDMLLMNEELSTSDIAKHLSLSVNAAYYHLEMMANANMINFRNQGRTVFYRLNSTYFKNVYEQIMRYGK